MGILSRLEFQEWSCWVLRRITPHQRIFLCCLLALGQRNCGIAHAVCHIQHSCYDCRAEISPAKLDFRPTCDLKSLNEASLERLGSRPEFISWSPLEVTTGIENNRLIHRTLPNTVDQASAKTIDHARAIQVVKIEDIQNDLNLMQKKVVEAATARRECAI